MTASKLRIDIRGLEKSFGEERVLKDLDLSLSSGNFYCLMAPSGTGKTTLLRLLMGLEAPDRGTMTIRLSPDGPLRTAAVFQEDRLLEGYTALQNLRFATGNRYTAEELTGLCREVFRLDNLVVTMKGKKSKRTEQKIRSLLEKLDQEG